MSSTSRDDSGARGDGSAGTPPRSFLAAAREPIIVAIFVLAGIFEVLSGDPVVHGAVLFAVAGVLSWDECPRQSGTDGAGVHIGFSEREGDR